MDEALAAYRLTAEQYEKLFVYRRMLLDWNTRVNLTAITGEREIEVRHFADSLGPLQFDLIPQGADVIDVGTGAGFPALPLLIARPDIRLTMLDSLGKRLVFLKAVLEELDLKAEILHARAEDGARGPLRARFDIALARAVASMSTLSEYLLPFLRVGGRAVAYKGEGGGREAEQAGAAIARLGGRIANVLSPDVAELNHTLVILDKIAPTPEKYPRKAPLPSKDPL